MERFLKASSTPIADIERVAYKGQPDKMRLYHSGFERFMDEMPVLNTDDEFLDEKVKVSREIMQKMAHEVGLDRWVQRLPIMENDDFQRTILAIESPSVGENGVLEAGHEIVLARWGHGFSSPVHGHTTGYLHEEILFGKMLVNTYRMTGDENKVRLVDTNVFEKGTFASLYTPPNPANKFKRQTLIHNFTSIGYSASLHYLSEHTRDGRDNRFVPEYFEDFYSIDPEKVRQITSFEAMYLQKGDVVLVRSSNVPWYGDHYIIVTGPVVQKAHGNRVQETTIAAPHTNFLLNQYDTFDGLVLLKLGKSATEAFYKFHDITIGADKVPVFPTA